MGALSRSDGCGATLARVTRDSRRSAASPPGAGRTAAGAGSGRASWWQRGLVVAQAVTLAGHLLPGGARLGVPAALRPLGGAAVVAGVAVSVGAARGLGPDLTPSVVPLDGARLQRGGLYGVSRHPIYGGLLLASAGTVVLRGRLSTLVAATALAVVLHVKSGEEDRLLADRFGAEHAAYRTAVPRLLDHRSPRLLLGWWRASARGRPAVGSGGR